VQGPPAVAQREAARCVTKPFFIGHVEFDWVVSNGMLLAEFEFRNGNLRRKFDGVKWGVRRTEDLLYELSIVGLSAPPPPP
jgi:hypothetical protein